VSDGAWIAIGCGVVAVAASYVWSAWKYDRAAKTYEAQTREAQRQLDESGDQQRQYRALMEQTVEQNRHYREMMEQTAEQQKRAATLMDRQEALVPAVEELVRRLESRL
jgi:Na+-translocating ferredoxin:NAD+ oxidoreductase RnfC subunit